MHVKHNNEGKKLVGVVGADGLALFVRYLNDDTQTIMINSLGEGEVHLNTPLEHWLKDNTKRTPIYKGDCITLQF